LNFLIHVSMARDEQLPQSVLAIPILSRFSPAEELFYANVCKDLTAHNKPDTHVPFSLCSLFRLQVRSFDLLEATPFHQLLSKLSLIKPWLDERLLRYINGIERKSKAILLDLNRDNVLDEPLSHPFYSGGISHEARSSARVVRLRHLIALQEQNFGVLSALLHELRAACTEKDYSLLTMLAVEPSLLEISPLKKGGRPDITNLAMSAIASAPNSAIKSDALCVLALQGQVLIDRLSEVLPRVGDEFELVDQLLVFLLAGKSSTSLWYGEVGTAV